MNAFPLAAKPQILHGLESQLRTPFPTFTHASRSSGQKGHRRYLVAYDSRKHHMKKRDNPLLPATNLPGKPLEM